ncbi:hypothetical protein [Cupriavidus campinensis]|uniref:hypothetical protein n=1 Tax=Cupriavidus campinensis TaxID=151783 RepID=UPI0024E1BCDF|nr:hypothetical protein [Cupriavidus campinensis]
MTRKLNVQTPGETPQTDETDADLITGETQANDEPEALDSAALAAKIRELEAENLKLKGDAEVAKQTAEDLKKADANFDRASASITRADREKFRNMRAEDVDPKKLVAAVLTKDGWVAPDQSGQKAKE